MQVYYTLQNISLHFWAWCIQKRISSNGLIIKHNISARTFHIKLPYSNAIELDKLLCKGISMNDFINKLNSYKVNGKDCYVMLMQNGIIE